MHSSSTLIILPGPIPEVKKKSALIDDYENIIAYWKNPSKGEQMWFVPNTFGESEGRYHLQGNFDIFTLI